MGIAELVELIRHWYIVVVAEGQFVLSAHPDASKFILPVPPFPIPTAFIVAHKLLPVAISLNCTMSPILNNPNA